MEVFDFKSSIVELCLFDWYRSRNFCSCNNHTRGTIIRCWLLQGEFLKVKKKAAGMSTSWIIPWRKEIGLSNKLDSLKPKKSIVLSRWERLLRVEHRHECCTQLCLNEIYWLCPKLGIEAFICSMFNCRGHGCRSHLI